MKNKHFYLLAIAAMIACVVNFGMNLFHKEKNRGDDITIFFAPDPGTYYEIADGYFEPREGGVKGLVSVKVVDFSPQDLNSPPRTIEVREIPIKNNEFVILSGGRKPNFFTIDNLGQYSWFDNIEEVKLHRQIEVEANSASNK